MTSLKDCFAKKSAVPETSSSSRCRSTAAVPCTSDSDPIIIETVTVPPGAGAESRCPLQCCNISSHKPIRLKITKESSSLVFGKRKRYFRPDWLQKFDWLILCKTE